ncbi:hypothetical protein [Nocardia terpenica]|uniref:Uncharacterized protein n=1 Tax=Nocardia terpenica TaxID=455432 RepID=A0A164HEZ4_9NOCA|nr:hypothetical protein [Nocardia terpenica]KZM68456.1 hypothetical protein AWN90_11335 [Nocardia terpenica]NQE88598.1 hypothetical protein [Nocardia terpenica]
MNVGVTVAALVAVTSASAAILRHTRREVVQSRALTLAYAAFAGFVLAWLAVLPMPDGLPVRLGLAWCGEVLGLVGACALTVHVATGFRAPRLVRAAAFSFLALAGTSVIARLARGDDVHELLRVGYAMCNAALLTVIGVTMIAWVIDGRRLAVTDALWALAGCLFLTMGLIGFAAPDLGYADHPIGWSLGLATIFIMSVTGILNHFKTVRTRHAPVTMNTAS